MFLNRGDLWVKYLVADEMNYLQQMQTKPLSHAGISH